MPLVRRPRWSQPALYTLSMQTYIGYGLVAAAVIVFVVALFDDPKKSTPFKFTAILLAVAGLAVLQLYGLAPSR